MKRIFSIFFLFFCTTSLFAKQSLAVYDFSAGENITQTEADYYSAVFRAEVVETELFNMMTRSELESLLTEQELSMSGLLSDEEKITLGNLLSVDCIVTGTLYELGTKTVLDIEVLNPETGELYFSGVTKGDETTLEEKVQELARKMSESVTGKEIEEESVSVWNRDTADEDEDDENNSGFFWQRNQDDSGSSETSAENNGFVQQEMPLGLLQLSAEYPVDMLHQHFPRNALNYSLSADLYFFRMLETDRGAFYLGLGYHLFGTRFAEINVWPMGHSLSMKFLFSQSVGNRSNLKWNSTFGLGGVLGNGLNNTTLDPNYLVDFAELAFSLSTGIEFKHTEAQVSLLFARGSNGYPIVNLNFGVGYGFDLF